MEITNVSVLKNSSIVLLRYIIIICLLLYFNSHCAPSNKSVFLSKNLPIPRLCGWFAEDSKATEEEILGNFTYFKLQGIECVNYMTDLPKYEKTAKIAQKIGIQIYAWLPAMLGVGYNKIWLYENHPEVYVITKSGINSYNQAIYGVSHYKFLCPNNPIVRTYLKEMYDNISQIPEIDGINLDYMRYIEENLK